MKIKKITEMHKTNCVLTARKKYKFLQLYERPITNLNLS